MYLAYLDFDTHNSKFIPFNTQLHSKHGGKSVVVQ